MIGKERSKAFLLFVCCCCCFVLKKTRNWKVQDKTYLEEAASWGSQSPSAEQSVEQEWRQLPMAHSCSKPHLLQHMRRGKQPAQATLLCQQSMWLQELLFKRAGQHLSPFCTKNHYSPSCFHSCRRKLTGPPPFCRVGNSSQTKRATRGKSSTAPHNPAPGCPLNRSPVVYSHLGK